MADSPNSPLSSVASDAMSDHDGPKHPPTQPTQPPSPSASSSIMPPSKRRRTGPAGGNTTAEHHNTPGSSHIEDNNNPPSPSSTISSDTSGEIPNSPGIQAFLGGSQDDDYSGHGSDQVSVCRWSGCEMGDLGNMDDLVRHIHEIHIANREKKFVCEWAGCVRNGQPHASGYALRAHMRSHTREKPFYCSLPECDRSFTRSDALAKHMRTVHETEALRPSDPVPKHQQGTTTPAGAGPGPGPGGQNKVQRIKLKLSQPKDETDHQQQQQQPQHQPAEPTPSITTPAALDDPTITASDIDFPDLPEYPTQDQDQDQQHQSPLTFDDHELSLHPKDLYRLLRRQINWAEKEGQQLREQWEGIRPKRKDAWVEKEAVFEDLIHAELRLLGAVVESNDHGPGGVDGVVGKDVLAGGHGETETGAYGLESERMQQEGYHREQQRFGMGMGVQEHDHQQQQQQLGSGGVAV